MSGKLESIQALRDRLTRETVAIFDEFEGDVIAALATKDPELRSRIYAEWCVLREWALAQAAARLEKAIASTPTFAIVDGAADAVRSKVVGDLKERVVRFRVIAGGKADE